MIPLTRRLVFIASTHWNHLILTTFFFGGRIQLADGNCGSMIDTLIQHVLAEIAMDGDEG